MDIRLYMPKHRSALLQIQRPASHALVWNGGNTYRPDYQNPTHIKQTLVHEEDILGLISVDITTPMNCQVIRFALKYTRPSRLKICSSRLLAPRFRRQIRQAFVVLASLPTTQWTGCWCFDCLFHILRCRL